MDDARWMATIEAAMATPGLARLTGGREVACLLLDSGAEQVLFASPAARRLAAAIADSQGRLDPALDLGRALRALKASGSTPKPHLVRLRFEAGRLSPPVVCAGLSVPGPDGAPVLAVIPVDPLPVLRARRPSRPPVQAAQGPVAEERPTASAAQHEAPRGTMRFLWRSDETGLWTESTAPLAAVVGTSPVGCAWDRLLAVAIVPDEAGLLREALEQRRTFRMLPVRWRIAGEERAVVIALSGAPRLGEGRAFAGFSGFGVIHLDRIEPAPPLPAAPPAGPVRQSLRERAAEVVAIGRAGSPVVETAPSGAAPAPVADLPAFATLAGATFAGFAGMMSAPFATIGLGWPFVPDDGHRRRTPNRTKQPDGPPPDPAPATPSSPAATSAGSPGAEAPSAEPEPQRPAEPALAEPAPALPEPTLAADAEPPEAAERPDTIPAVDAAGSAEAAGADPVATETAEAVGPALVASQLSLTEHAAFREIARALGARFAGDATEEDAAPVPPDGEARGRGEVTPFRLMPAAARTDRTASATPVVRLLERLPAGVLIHRGEDVLFANRHLLALAGYESGPDLAAAGGPGLLFRGRDPASLPVAEAGHPIGLATRSGGTVAVAVALTTVEWEGAPASLLLIRRLPDADPVQGLAAAEIKLALREANLGEAQALLDATTEAILTLDEQGRVLRLNRAARALFGHDLREVAGEDFATLLPPESRPEARAALHRARLGETGSAEVAAQGRAEALALTALALSTEGERRYAVLLRDVTPLRRTEAELQKTRREAEAAGGRRADFLAALNHEIRTPLNAVLGFTEVMLDEPFGPIGADRYRDYLRDIRTSGEHVLGLVTDLFDLARIEAGRLDLTFAGVALNDLVGGSVSQLQAQAARQRVVVRTSFAAGLRPVLADLTSLRQASLHLIGNAIRYTEAGGQVIVSTAMTDRGGVALRVRDTGAGLTQDEIETALQPFRQVVTTPERRGLGGGLALPLTKALVEANRGTFTVTSRKNEGTLVEVLFPPGRVLAG
ncbi:ATP-binding protein [Methylobacterium isbiliense]|uniref:histidine kinase n=1 Tax=Methylobacterium isbiliense TaxID=315478 RepID=A0ABQ4SFT4_9HYPH|nr:ATP-binding protein [Methylobacterium isbiliense]MDN3624895.1 histidine kinase dimerization/phospho-acceptor domain-containing protein [Methylobacterium isbiliense]GJE01952.1 Sensor histidine kinase RcsC [Methylobacterium isbiliense]